ncbi:hypothetical protein B0H11DRAFT_1912931 [Mycena galericulata]|nr:hypothetical protein B0H11DRAFT_1912931 [Mycena galericulata]
MPSAASKTKRPSKITKPPKTVNPSSTVKTASPTWKEMVAECIVASDRRKGVSRPDIKKFVWEKYSRATPTGSSSCDHLNNAIRALVKSGKFVQPKVDDHGDSKIGYGVGKFFSTLVGTSKASWGREVKMF